MTRNEKYNQRRRRERRDFLRGFPLTLFDGPGLVVKLPFAALYFLGAVWVWGQQEQAAALAQGSDLISPVLRLILENIFPAYLIIGGAALLILLCYPIGRKAAEEELHRVGLVNHAGEAPALLRKRRDRNHPNITIWEFDNRGIPLNEWEDKQTNVETALDLNIVKMKYSKGKRRILLYAAPARAGLPDVLPWKDKYLSPESFVLVLGESLLGPVTVNLAHIPHILLGGSTGSGKSVLLKLLLMQAIHKGAQVYIADFKGGVDFPPAWREPCRMCFEEQDLLNVLTGLVEELERRKRAFAEAGCPDIDRYNRATEEDLERLIFACDEVAEVLDRTGADSERKKLLGQIENKLATIARLGRAFGIHLIIATQRPDANLIPGQIKNNMDFRVCGRADSVLSQIILDNTSAADQILKDARGRFITGDGTVFQGYLFDEEQL